MAGKAMSRAFTILAAPWLLVSGAPIVPAPTSPEVFLAGNWLEVSDDPEAKCGSPVGRGEQIAFEFKRSGGRLLRYEPVDLFTSIGGIKLEEKDGVIAASAETRDGERRPLTRLRRVDADSFEFLGADGKPASKWGRCPAVPDPIGADVSLPNLLVLTPPYSGGQSFVELLPGESLSDLCEGKIGGWENPRGALQFELLAPGHSIVIADRVEELHFFARATAIHQPAPDTLRLTLDSLGKPLTEINIRITADFLEIPELHARFGRCSKDVALGMHRM